MGTQQYLLSVMDDINNGSYIHPFKTKPSLLPKSRISKLMKLDPATFKITSVTLDLMAILIEIFIRDLVSRSFKYTINDNRKILQLQDICHVVQADHMYDFLIDIVPRIHSYDQQSNMYHLLYTSEMEHCLLARNDGDNKQNQEEIPNDTTTIIRRSERIKLKKADK